MTDYSLELIISNNVQHTAESIQHATIIRIHQFANIIGGPLGSCSLLNHSQTGYN
jgi:hypothetical protein